MECKGTVVFGSRSLLGQRGRLGGGVSNGPSVASVAKHEAVSLLSKERSEVRLGLAGKLGDVVSHHLAIQDAIRREAEGRSLQKFFGLVG